MTWPGLDGIAAEIPPADATAAAAASAHLDRLTKPPGSLGGLEAIVIRLAGIRGRLVTDIERPVVVVFAGDHGVAARGVSAYPPEVTAQMVANFVAGGAAINVLARAAGAGLVVVDIGVAGSRADRSPGTPRDRPDRGRAPRPRRVAPGTRDLSIGPAMTRRRGPRARSMSAGRSSRDLIATAPTWSRSARWGSATRPPQARSWRR